MQRWSPPPTYAAVFGSAARGEMRSDSDIDLFLVRPDSPGADWDEQVSDLAIGASRWTGNDVRPLVLTRADIDTGAAPTDVGTVEPVLAEIVRDAITVIGSPTWLSRRIAAARGSHA